MEAEAEGRRETDRRRVPEGAPTKRRHRRHYRHSPSEGHKAENHRSKAASEYGNEKIKEQYDEWLTHMNESNKQMKDRMIA